MAGGHGQNQMRPESASALEGYYKSTIGQGHQYRGRYRLKISCPNPERATHGLVLTFLLEEAQTVCVETDDMNLWGAGKHQSYLSGTENLLHTSNIASAEISR